MAFDVTIVEQPIRMIMQSDNWQIGLTFATIIVAISAVTTLVISYNNTKKQLELSRAEFRHKTRPILARRVFQKRLENTKHNGDTYTFLETKVLFHFINNGTTTASNVRKKHELVLHDRGFDFPLLDPLTSLHDKSLPDLAPTEYYSIDMEWDSTFLNESLECNRCYFALIIWYDDEDYEYYYHMEGHFDRKELMLDYVRTGNINTKKKKSKFRNIF